MIKRFFTVFIILILVLVSCESPSLDDPMGGTPGGDGIEEPVVYEIEVSSSQLNFAAEGGEQSVEVVSNIDYEVLCEASWILCEKVDDGVVVSAKSHESNEKRSAELVIFNREHEIYKLVTIVQAAYVPQYVSSATLAKSEIAWDELTVEGATSGNPASSYVVRVLRGGDFCTIAPATGKVGEKFVLNFTKNMNSTERTAEVKIEFTDGYSQKFTVRQLAAEMDLSYYREWAEQPEKVENRHYLHKTYYSTLMDGKRVRNFSVCYDTVKMCSRWVAYPAHSVYRKWGSYQVGENNNSGRTNAWAFDDAITEYAPNTDYNMAYSIVSKYDSKTGAYDTATMPIIPHRRQADICYDRAFGWGWARGHMLPSSQRYNTWENNAQTCYATNIMVQQYDFNGGSWAEVESLERNKNCSDTLYVVVGTLFEDDKTISRFDRTIGVPTHCYKLLLRTKSGNSGKAIKNITSADELICIGFLFENSESSANIAKSKAATSVAEIEKRSGFKFFQNLNAAIADKVKAQNKPSDWGI